MPKEKNYNPVQAERKAEKAKALKKGKSEAVARKNEKLAKRNPARIQKEIDELKLITTNGGKLSKHEESVLEGLERDLKAVNKAREALGDKAPTFGRGPYNDDRGDGVLGKRRRGRGDDSSDDSDVPDDVKSIPMPRDTPPPIPKAILDEWFAKRRAKRNANNPHHNRNDNEASKQGKATETNTKRSAPAAPVESRTVYEAKPVVRDLRKEAVSAFVPAAVRMKMDKSKGQGGLMEPEEADQLEREGYLRTNSTAGQSNSATDQGGPRGVTMEDVEDEDE
ncbi:WW domain binding protein 11-domain-containing protein [Microdochium trichocladiopsis]|uniref:WW domain binding protein 11-domain-containing protein n=1 Tax=Microdochium trichocladiopsis TaxID=1682393 RepID=A0A9P9BUE3_9PEZI|nr:WW domain binding protein 11-domain-containing protein [Microdochium trichocladiopsis]KAH7037541.1 WW domain binding protein 11-domain-containing protein [Microdochium trichocladiopsis]